MAVEKVYLDPNAAAYTDDEIVAKVNTATSTVSADKIADGTTNKAYTSTEKSKLSGVESGAQVNPANLAALDSVANSKLAGIEEGATTDQTATEVRDAIVGLSDNDRQIIITRPTTGQKKIYAIQTHSNGKTELEENSVPEG